MTRPGSTNTIAESVPAELAMVWTMLFSWMVDPGKRRRIAIEMTAAESTWQRSARSAGPDRRWRR
jgi:hypothetical protein